ncbi:MAG TPA: HAMP domain-containing histidine kinase [Desulfuromonadales bacterium]|nr:HAMP domain-containing histidine kinase [Desulfuromonadales bacterium]
MKPTSRKDIFQAEFKILDAAEKVLHDPENCQNSLRVHFEELTSGYKKLLQQSTQLVTISDRQQDRLLKLQNLKDDFLSTASHELRTPITSILGFTQVIRKKLEEVVFPQLPPDDVKTCRIVQQISDNIGIIISEGERLTNLINDLLDFSKMQAGKIEWKSEPLDMAEIINRATAATSSLFDKKEIRVEKSIDGDLPDLVGDGDRLIQVMINLLSNAVKFSDRGAVICRARKTESGVVISVADSGSGIAPKYHNAVFEKFRQVGTVHADMPKGTGLGLPICKEIVEHHGGRIWVESEPGKGSTFSFEIPAMRDLLQSIITTESE